MSITASKISSDSSFPLNNAYGINLRKRYIIQISIILTIALWVYGDYLIVSDLFGGIQKPRVLFVPFNLFILMMPIISAAFLFSSHRKKLFSLSTIVVIYSFMIYSVLGYINEFNISYYKENFLTLIALYSGFSFMWLVLKTKNPQYYLIFMMIFFSLFLLLKTYIDLSVNNFISRRYTSPILWNYSSVLYFLTGINAVWSIVNNRKVFFLITLISWSIIFYSGVILGATRSLGITLTIVIIFSVLSSYIISKQRQKNSGLQRMILIAGIVFFLVFLYRVIIGSYFSGVSDISMRIQADGNVFARLVEAVDYVSGLRPIDILVGRGLGTTVKTVLGETHIPHIAIFWFLGAFGIIPFVYIVYLLYLKIPHLYFKNIIAFKNSGRINTILIVGPALFGWSATLMISGGISYFSFFGIGMTIYLMKYETLSLVK